MTGLEVATGRTGISTGAERQDWDAFTFIDVVSPYYGELQVWWPGNVVNHLWADSKVCLGHTRRVESRADDAEGKDYRGRLIVAPAFRSEGNTDHQPFEPMRL